MRKENKMRSGKKSVGPTPGTAPLLCLLLLFTAFSVHAQSSSQNYRLFTSVLDESGGSSTSAGKIMAVSSAGQPTPIGLSQSGNYRVYAGYLYTLEVECGLPPEIVETTLPDGIEGCPYTETLEVQSGTGTQPLEWTVVDGSLPPGLELGSTTGEISGSPTATGPFEFTVQVADFCGETDAQGFSIEIGQYVDIKGDANADCRVNVLDLVVITNCCILENELCTYPDCTEDLVRRSDINGPPGHCDGDGAVNVLDSIKIVRIILELDECP